MSSCFGNIAVSLWYSFETPCTYAPVGLYQGWALHFLSSVYVTIVSAVIVGNKGILREHNLTAPLLSQYSSLFAKKSVYTLSDKGLFVALIHATYISLYQSGIIHPFPGVNLAMKTSLTVLSDLGCQTLASGCETIDCTKRSVGL